MGQGMAVVPGPLALLNGSRIGVNRCNYTCVTQTSQQFAENGRYLHGQFTSARYNYWPIDPCSGSAAEYP